MTFFLNVRAYPWNMLYHPYVNVGSSLVYLAILFVLYRIMKNRKAFDLKVPMQVYDVVQIVLCSYMLYGFWRNPFVNPFRINTPYEPVTEYFIFVHYISKWLDFLDTIFMILRHKEEQVTVLHVYHHSSIGLIWGYLLYVHAGYGTTAIGCTLNSFVHIIMYSHYLITSLRWRNPFKKYITQIQLLQFIIAIMHAVTVIMQDTHMQWHLPYIQIGYQITMLIMFGNFYRKAYTKGRKSSASSDVDKAKPARSVKAE